MGVRTSGATPLRGTCLASDLNAEILSDLGGVPAGSHGAADTATVTQAVLASLPA